MDANGYLDFYASKAGLDVSLLKRWLHAAGFELAADIGEPSWTKYKGPRWDSCSARSNASGCTERSHRLGCSPRFRTIIVSLQQH